MTLRMQMLLFATVLLRAQNFSFDRTELRSTTIVAGLAAAAADFNRDAAPDLVLCTANKLEILLGRGDGTFRDPVFLDFPGCFGVAAGDFNGDGKLDLAVKSTVPSPTPGALPLSAATVLLGAGDGSFSHWKTSVLAFDQVADVNGDGLDDLIQSPDLFDGAILYLNRGDGTFEKRDLGIYGDLGAVLGVADLNGDGKLDLVYYPFEYSGDADGRRLYVQLGRGDGTFQDAVQTSLPENFCAGNTVVGTFAFADVDGDGKLDLVFGCNIDVAFLKGTGDGTFQLKSRRPSGTVQPHPAAIRLVDLNGDGKLDVVVANWFPNYITVLLGNGDGTFQPYVDVSGAAYDLYLVADLNGDGRPDIVIPNDTDRVVSVLLNSTPPGLATPAVTSATGFAAPAVAPGSLATLRGTFLASGTRVSAETQLPVSLAGATVRVNGVAAPLLYTSATQINFQVPFELTAGAANIELDRGFAHLAASDVRIEEAAPQIFTLNETGGGAGLLLHADGLVVLASAPAHPGETITALCTGLGKLKQNVASGLVVADSNLETASTPVVTVGALPAQVKFSGLAKGYAGLYRVDFVVPDGAPKGASVPLRLAVGAAVSSAVEIAIN